jgi:hypothetical protein
LCPVGRKLDRRIRSHVFLCMLAYYLQWHMKHLTRIKRGGQWSRAVVCLLSRLSPEPWQALGLLQLKRNYWVIESRRHHRRDISMQEDFSRARTPNAALVPGRLRRVVLSVSNAAADQARTAPPQSKANTKNSRQRLLSARGGRERLHALIFAQNPQVLDLAKSKDAS